MVKLHFFELSFSRFHSLTSAKLAQAEQIDRFQRFMAQTTQSDTKIYIFFLEIALIANFIWVTSPPETEYFLSGIKDNQLKRFHVYVTLSNQCEGSMIVHITQHENEQSSLLQTKNYETIP
jgi:hypothetical protein